MENDLKFKFPFPDLALPRPPLAIKNKDEQVLYYDIFRNNWFFLSPEEWVRQHVLFWLLSRGGWPKDLLSIERQVGNSKKRLDVLAYDQNGKPNILIECKSFQISISAETARQAMQYNERLNCPFIWLSNGMQQIFFHWDGLQYKKIPSLPHFSDLKP